MSFAKVEVVIFDTTLRDGAQSLPDNHQFPTGAKPEIAHTLARMGAGVIEAGFPETLGDGEEVAVVAQTVGRQCYEVERWSDGGLAQTARVTPVIAGLTRAMPETIDTTWEAIRHADYPRIHTFVPTDAEHVHARFPGKNQMQIQRMGIRAVRYAKEISQEHKGASVEFSAEAASTTSYEYLAHIVRHAVEAGADVINVPDTVGQRDPLAMKEFYSNVLRWALDANPFVTVSAHNHNDLGQAVANTNMLVVAATEYAQKLDIPVRIQLETTVCGLGERAGNADVFPVMANMFRLSPSDVPVEWHFNPGRAVATAREVMGHARLEVPRQSPIVGSDINKHRSGIHSDGVIKGGHRIYTPFDPTFWGHEQDAVHEKGRYQGARGRNAAN